ncbi:S1C family serine protease [Bacillus songklensis]|uniref:S1C family serine protease n=1 Tax=Bacillus songklensis TaxID=1069116 RepID=A0ABV8BAQ8_9BACI
MGYYDQDYEKREPRSSRGRGRWFFSALIGAIIGALIMLFSLPALSRMNLLPYNAGVNEEDEVNEKGVNVRQTVAVDVTTDVTKAVDKASEAVVGVVNIQQSNFWNEEKSDAGTGSGVIYKKAGNRAFVVTNHHVIEGANQIEVSLSDGSRVPARLLGSDALTDLAVLEMSSEHVSKIAEFGDSDAVKPGEPVIAIGNPLGLQFSGSVTQGIISGTNRVIPQDLNGDGIADWQSEVIQTDAAINPGNSGGALINIAGKLIGINSMKIAEQAVEGIGLAIPVNLARPIIEDLEKYGEVRRPYMGVSLQSISEISGYHLRETLKLPKSIISGVAVLGVEPLSPAAQAGMREFDVIVALDGQEIRDVIDLRKHLYTKKEIGDEMEVTFYREGKKKTVTMKLAKETF